MNKIEKVDRSIDRSDNFSNQQPATSNQHKAYIDILRIIACLMVIFNHTNERGFSRYAMSNYAVGSTSWTMSTFMSISCKAAVYIFFTISGALLLGKQESIKKTYSRLIKFVVDILVFSSIYFGIECYNSGYEFNLEFIRQNIIAWSYWHLWYLYAHIALILSLPFLRDFARNLSLENWKLMYAFAVIITGILPIIEQYQVINGSLKISWITTSIVIYPITGYVLDNKIEITSITIYKIIKLWLINTMAFGISLVTEYYYINAHPGDFTETYLTLFVLVNASVIFITAKYVAMRVNFRPVVSKLISEMSKLTFGIYLLHILILWKIPQCYSFWIAHFESGNIKSHIGVYGTCVAVFLICAIIVAILKKLPLIRKII